eukprot:7456819-Alexandrium_andersonii.AAC.1
MDAPGGVALRGPFELGPPAADGRAIRQVLLHLGRAAQRSGTKMSCSLALQSCACIWATSTSSSARSCGARTLVGRRIESASWSCWRPIVAV